LDQENGGLNSVFDADYIHQFPSAMGLAACNSLELTRSISSAAAKELACLGFNWLVGPVFDVHSTDKPQPMGVRCFGEDPEYVAKQALEAMLGYRSGGIIPCAKHFPGFGNLDFLGSPSDIPIISGTFDELLSTFLVPFQTAIDNKLDSIMVAACRMPDAEGAKVPYACLSHAVITGLLRRRMGFGGVIMTECLEIESLYESVGVSQASVMAISAGCDMIEICNSFSNQLEAINGILVAVKSGLISEHQIRASAERVRQMKLRHLTWDRVWNPGGMTGLTKLQSINESLSKTSYDASITLVRDAENFIPLSKKVAPSDKLLLLTPLVDPFGPKRSNNTRVSSESHDSVNIIKSSTYPARSYLEGEVTFHEFGVAIAKRWRGKVIHTSYTASGISPLHEKLVSDAAVVVLLTADGVRNMYQYGFTKYIVNLCKTQTQSGNADEKPCVVVAVSSPYDFLKENQISTYLCTYDLTDPALDSLVRALFGKLTPTGVPPNASQLRQQKSIQKKIWPHQLWLVEELRPDRDAPSVQQLLDRVGMAASNTFGDPEAQYPPYYFHSSYYLANYQPLVLSQHFIVRNSSTQAVYGFCATYYIEALSRGCIAAIVVGTEHRGKGIGHSLHQHALKHLQKFANIETVHFGSDLPAIFAGIPNRLSSHQLGLRNWVKNRYDRSFLL
jgi:beta-N-acetylhexosaminidase